MAYFAAACDDYIHNIIPFFILVYDSIFIIIITPEEKQAMAFGKIRRKKAGCKEQRCLFPF